MSDVRALDNFTSIIHTTPSPLLSPENNPLPTPFTVCIIGASRGIGAGLATSYARAGCTTLILAARSSSTPQLEAVAQEATAQSPRTAVHVRAVELTDAGSVKALAESVRATCGRLDVLVLNSGCSGAVELKVTDGDALDGAWADVFGVNALGTYHAAHCFVPLLLESGTRDGGAKAFVVVGSIAAAIVDGPIANTKYCVSKMAQVRIVEHVAEQFKEEGLLAVAVHPGAVPSEMALETTPEVFMKYLVDDPQLCGAFCVWLTRQADQFRWLSGRLLSATWDPNGLLEKKDDIVRGDLLKLRFKTSVDV